MKKLFTLLFLFTTLSLHAQNTALEYIEKYKNLAIAHMNEQGLPASVILAVSMHESANGRSKIAKYLNNHFGIKGKNTSREIKSAYRGYDSVSDSYHDFIAALKRNKKSEKLFNKYSSHDYYNWILGIQSGGYAASKLWGSQVLAIIKKYQLYELDTKADSISPEFLLAMEKATSPTIVQPKASNYYRVKSGDTLSAIARKFGTSTSSLMKKNALNNTRLAIGQKLVL